VRARGAEVEFGNLLVLASRARLIIDWNCSKRKYLRRRLVRPSVERVESGLGLTLKSLVADRGFDNKTNIKWLEERGTFAGLFPVIRALCGARRMKRFAQAQRRRAQTEGASRSLKMNFSDDQCVRRGLPTAPAVTWATHARFMGKPPQKFAVAAKDPGTKT